MKEFRLKQVASGSNEPLFILFEKGMLVTASYSEDEILRAARLRKMQDGVGVHVTIKRVDTSYIVNEVLVEEREPKEEDETSLLPF